MISPASGVDDRDAVAVDGVSEVVPVVKGRDVEMYTRVEGWNP
jgi:hypothetical protein